MAASSRLQARVAAEAVDAAPGRKRQGRDEALALEAAAGEDVGVAHRKEVGLALEAVTLVELGQRKPFRLQHAPVVGLLAGPGRQQVGQEEGLVFERRSASTSLRKPALAG